MVMAPEDVVAHKLLLSRGVTEGKHDLADVEAILRRQSLSIEYVQERARLLGAEALIAERLAALGVEVA
jgi:hypothetical protein